MAPQYIRGKIEDLKNVGLLMRLYLLDAADWTPTSKCRWENHFGGQIILQDDIVTCVTTLESKVMHKIAVRELAMDFNINLRNSPHGSKIKKPNIILGSIIHFTDGLATCRHEFNEFGLSLEEAIKLDYRRPSYKRLQINNAYKLHVPYFVLQCVTLIETFGLGKESIFLKVGDSERFFELDFILTNDSEEFKFDDEKDVLEVATLFKFYLKNIPGGLFTRALERCFVNARGLDFAGKIKMFNCLVRSLPRANRETAFLLLSLLNKISLTPGNGMDSQLLSNAFTWVLFRKKTLIENRSREALQFLIDNFTRIFTLKAEHLDKIYRHIADSYPTKLHKCLQRRVNQCHCNPTDIPRSLLILTNQFRSFDAQRVNIYRHMNHRSAFREDVFLHNHNYLVALGEELSIEMSALSVSQEQDSE